MRRRRAKTYAKTIFLALSALFATAFLDTAWNYTGNNANSESASVSIYTR